MPHFPPEGWTAGLVAHVGSPAACTATQWLVLFDPWTHLSPAVVQSVSVAHDALAPASVAAHSALPASSTVHSAGTQTFV